MGWNPAEVVHYTLIGNIIMAKIFPRFMDDQYSYYEETVNRKVNMKIL